VNQLFRVFGKKGQNLLAAFGIGNFVGFDLVPVTYDAEFVHKGTEPWVWLLENPAGESHPHLRAVVSAEGGSVLDERDFATESRGGESRIALAGRIAG